MRIDSVSEPYLKGDLFSNGFKFAVDRTPMTSRNALLQQLARDKVVLHYGCADHLELIAKKRAANTYLHDILGTSAKRLIGTDIDREALAAMSRLGIPDLYYPSELPKDVKYDLVLAPDVIEHVPNVGQFLDELAQFGADVVITTPNAFRLLNRTQMRGELVNSDHRYWFSPYTLAKTVVEAGYEVRSFWYTDFAVLRQPIRTIAKKMFPFCRDGLAVLARPAA